MSLRSTCASYAQSNHKSCSHDPPTPSHDHDQGSARLDFKEALYLATQGGADCLNMGTQIGSLHVGKAFDALLMDAAKVRMQGARYPEVSPVSALSCIGLRGACWRWIGVKWVAYICVEQEGGGVLKGKEVGVCMLLNHGWLEHSVLVWCCVRRGARCVCSPVTVRKMWSRRW